MIRKIKITQTVISFILIATKMVFAFQEFFKKKISFSTKNGMNYMKKVSFRAVIYIHFGIEIVSSKSDHWAFDF